MLERGERKAAYIAVKELYDLVKTEKRQDILGEVLINWG